MAITQIKGSNIADGTVVAADVADDAVTTAKILDANVTNAKIAGMATSKLTGTVTDAQIAGMASSKLSGALPAVDGSALTNTIYDIGFTAGFDSDMVKENVAVATYGEMVMARAGTFVGEAGYVDTAPTGAILIVDIMKNGTTIYASTKPQFAISATALTAGVITVTTFAVADRITFKVTQIGSTEAGEGVRFTLKGKI